MKLRKAGVPLVNPVQLPLFKSHLLREEVAPSTLVMIADVYHARLWCGLCGDFAVTDLFDVAVTDMLFLVVLMIILRRPSAAACARWYGGS